MMKKKDKQDSPMLNFNFAGKVVLITGGRRGIGRALSFGFAKAGADIAIVAQSPDAVIAESITKQGVQCRYYMRDLSCRQERAGLVQQVVADFGAIDIMINNAGRQETSPINDYGLDRWDMDIELMLTAVFDLSVQGAEFMKAAGGKIINIASISSFQGARNIVGYATAKHGLVGLTKCLANELAACRVNVNAVAPGIVETEMAASSIKNPEKYRELSGRIPARRFARPDDIVSPVMFLASSGAEFIHGHVLLVDGGWMGR